MSFVDPPSSFFSSRIAAPPARCIIFPFLTRRVAGVFFSARIVQFRLRHQHHHEEQAFFPGFPSRISLFSHLPEEIRRGPWFPPSDLFVVSLATEGCSSCLSFNPFFFLFHHFPPRRRDRISSAPGDPLFGRRHSAPFSFAPFSPLPPAWLARLRLFFRGKNGPFPAALSSPSSKAFLSWVLVLFFFFFFFFPFVEITISPF